MEQKDIDNLFTYHRPSPEDVEAMQQIRESARELATLISVFVPDGEDQKKAIDSVRQASMWANAGIALNSDKA